MLKNTGESVPQLREQLREKRSKCENEVTGVGVKKETACTLLFAVDLAAVLTFIYGVGDPTLAQCGGYTTDRPSSGGPVCGGYTTDRPSSARPGSLGFQTVSTPKIRETTPPRANAAHTPTRAFVAAL